MKTFPSKRDLWFTLVIWCAAGAIAWSIVVTPAHGWAAIMVRALAASSAGAMLWALYGTRYSFDETDLVVRVGPLRWSVPLASMRSVECAWSLESAPACSLDRLRIAHATGTLVISPRDREGFVRELGRRQSR